MGDIETRHAPLSLQVVDLLNIAAFRPEIPVAPQVDHLRPGVGDNVRQAFAGVSAQLELKGVVAGLADALVVEGGTDIGERTAQGRVPGSRRESDVPVSTLVQPATMLT